MTEPVAEIKRKCKLDLDVFLARLQAVILKKKLLPEWEKEALEKDLVALLHCVHTAEQELK